MRRLFLLLDLALLRHESANERQAVLRQVQIVLARLWAASYRAGTGEFSWGYALVDSTVSELSLKARLRRTATKLGELRQMLIGCQECRTQGSYGCEL